MVRLPRITGIALVFVVVASRAGASEPGAPRPVTAGPATLPVVPQGWGVVWQDSTPLIFTASTRACPRRPRYHPDPAAKTATAQRELDRFLVAHPGLFHLDPEHDQLAVRYARHNGRYVWLDSDQRHDGLHVDDTRVEGYLGPADTLVWLQARVVPGLTASAPPAETGDRARDVAQRRHPGCDPTATRVLPYVRRENGRENVFWSVTLRDSRGSAWLVEVEAASDSVLRDVGMFNHSSR